MAYPIKRTKIILPRRQHSFLSRQRLLDMLDDILEYRLTLVAAPAGYGKTSLLVDLAHEVEYPVCWLALDSLDYDPVRFINYFVAALQDQFPEFGGPSRSLLDNLDLNDLDLEQLLQTIINDLYDHVQEHFAIVLDDFHLIESNPDINYFINHFIQEMDENCHLVVATRSLLSLPDLPLMIGRSQVQGLSFEELAFLPGEIRDLYQLKYQQEISDQKIEQIMDESEGWITGLLLTAETERMGETDQGRAARAAGIDLYDYLARQVLDQQSPEMQDFLLRTSLLEEFNADLCQQALGDPGGDDSWRELIRQLHHKNLFIQPVESGGTWLRYHHLFRDFLQQQYKKEHSQGSQDLLRKLVDVYRDQGWYEKAYGVSKQIGNESQTAEFIESISTSLVHGGQVSMLKNWLDELSPSLIEKYPGLIASQGVLASMTGNPEEGLGILNRALDYVSRDQYPATYAQILVRRATCNRYVGNYQKGLDDALKSLEITVKVGEDNNLGAEAEREIGLNRQSIGQTQEAKIHLERSLEYYASKDDHDNAAYVKTDLGLMNMNEGNYPAARTHFNQVYQLWEERGNLSELVGLNNNLGVLDYLLGDYQEAYLRLIKGLEYARQTSNVRVKAYALASLGDLALDLGAHSRAERYINDSFEIAEQIGDTYLQIYLQLATASLARINGDIKTARRLLDSESYQLRDFPTADEKGRFHLENGQLLLEEGRQVLAENEFQAALKIFSKNNLPVETCLSQVQLARLDCLRGDTSQAEDRMGVVQKKIRSLGTIQPLVPTLSRQEELLSCLESHLPKDEFTADLVRAVSDFHARLPGLVEEMGIGHPLIDSSQQPFLDITAMGRVSVLRHGVAISVPEWTKQKTVRELFFYLLSYPEGASREEICLEFWPDSQPEQLKKQFKNALYRLRRAVGSDTILYHQPTRLYHFNRHLDYRYDVEEFYKFLEQAETERNQERKIQILRLAADLYRHPFAPALEGIWSEPVRYRLNFDYERTMLLIAGWQFSQEKYEAALQTVEDLLLALPGQEEAWRLAMRSYAEKADRAGIERAFQRCRQALAQDLDAEPSEETYALYQELMS